MLKHKLSFVALLVLTGALLSFSAYAQQPDFVDEMVTDPYVLESMGFSSDADYVFERYYLDDTELLAPESASFGTGTFNTTFAARFLQERIYNSFHRTTAFNGGMEHLTCDTTGVGAYVEGEIQLPHGALLTTFSLWTYDANASGKPNVNIWQICANPEAIGGYNYTIIVSDTGDTAFDSGQRYVTKAMNATINSNTCYYMFQVSLSSCGTTGVEKARFGWQRQISPAPGVATFGDVPTNHIFFQNVEALAASGITSGCGGGNYCPDAPVTRGQMAAFLSRAFGL